MLHPVRCATLSLALLCAPGCSTAKTSSSTASATPKHSTNELTAEEVTQTGAANVYDAIQRLRPERPFVYHCRAGRPGLRDASAGVGAHGQPSSDESTLLPPVPEARDVPGLRRARPVRRPRSRG